MIDNGSNFRGWALLRQLFSLQSSLSGFSCRRETANPITSVAAAFFCARESPFFDSSPLPFDLSNNPRSRSIY